ncbi:hypothetical protein Syun_009499 [Stephania yunnanensis]|uniref:Uncharacterized protein n=1 Tax=Stephania yunnanensis TaxID=152371 RepID=A0AAP0KFN8_9MAGN
MNEDPRPYPPKAILAQGHTLILLCRVGLLRDELGSSATSKQRTHHLSPPSIYARATSSQHILNYE